MSNHHLVRTNIEQLIEKLPEDVRNLRNDYGSEYWVIPAIVNYFKPNIVVELGTDVGISARMISAVLQSYAMFFSIDHVDCTHHLGGINVFPIKGDTMELGKNWHLPIDVLYIDARHTYEHVTNELNTFGSLARKAIVLHDPIVVPEVGRAIDDWMKKNSVNWEYELYKGDRNIGMGILWHKQW